MRFFWAFVLILFGVAGLGANIGLWDGWVLAKLFSFWPLVLVFWGIDLVFKKTQLYFLVLFAALLISGLLIYDFVFSNDPVIITKKNTNQGCCRAVKNTIIADLPKEADEIYYKFNTGAIDFKIKSGTEKLIEGNYNSNVSEFRSKVEKNDKAITYNLNTLSVPRGRRVWMLGSLVNQLELNLNKSFPVGINIESGASNLDFDFSEINIENLHIKAGASRIYTKLGEKTENGARVEFDSGASLINISVPKSYGVKLVLSTGLSTKNFEGFNKVSESEYFSENYQLSKNQIEIVMKAGASAINLDRY